MCSTSNRCRIDFCCQEKGGAVGSKLDPERREKVDEFERVAAGTFLIQGREGGSGNNEDSEGHQEAYSLHTLPAIVFVVYEESSEMVTDQGTANVDQIVQPQSNHLAGVGGDEGQEH